MTPLSLNPWLYLPAAAIALLGFWLLHIALFRDRSHAGSPRPRCPKCWYDLSGIAPTTAYDSTSRDRQGADSSNNPLCVCPECGRAILHPRDLHQTRRKPLLALIALPLLALLPTLSYFRGDLRRAWYALPPKWTTVETIRVGGTVAKLQKLRNPDDRGMRVNVTSRGKTILDVEDFDIEFGQARWLPDGSRDAARIGAGNDLDIDGTNELMIYAYSGGAHCCYTVYILELSDPPRIVATIDARNGMSAEIETIGSHKGHALLSIPDQSFDYWNAPHAASPTGSVFYRLEDHYLRIAPDRMIMVVQPWNSAQTRLNAVGQSFLRDPATLPPELWAAMLDLIYSGHEDMAWEFFDTAWPPSRPGKDAFKQEFLVILNKSPQYRDFKAALAAQAEGKPIPPALVGQYVPEPPEAPALAAPTP